MILHTHRHTLLLCSLKQATFSSTHFSSIVRYVIYCLLKNLHMYINHLSLLFNNLNCANVIIDIIGCILFIIWRILIILKLFNNAIRSTIAPGLSWKGRICGKYVAIYGMMLVTRNVDQSHSSDLQSIDSIRESLNRIARADRVYYIARDSQKLYKGYLAIQWKWRYLRCLIIVWNRWHVFWICLSKYETVLAVLSNFSLARRYYWSWSSSNKYCQVTWKW